MNVLLIGGSGSLINSLIVKFKKEGHRIFLLTGDRYKKQKYEPVFERYNFAYSSENLQEIMESVRPDITIYTVPGIPADLCRHLHRTDPSGQCNFR